MIVRVVQMTFQSDRINDFTALFEERKETIRSFPGCTHLELWQDTKDQNKFFTYSHWESEAHLDHYRFSEFFRDTWGLTKALFAEKPQAWSVTRKSIG
ncbi:MAG: antibiotic biosynthesis monooxygenase [Flavipsychrobacter sp.]|nr:antibiotic biosynthesis monooxygenase [Flavipsychrobacter sp.]